MLIAVNSIATPGSSVVHVSGVSEESAVALLDADCVRERMDVFDGKSTLAASIVRQEAWSHDKASER
jgi:hypothetical protein